MSRAAFAGSVSCSASHARAADNHLHPSCFSCRFSGTGTSGARDCKPAARQSRKGSSSQRQYASSLVVSEAAVDSEESLVESEEADEAELLEPLSLKDSQARCTLRRFRAA